LNSQSALLVRVEAVEVVVTVEIAAVAELADAAKPVPMAKVILRSC
jgi:hypothetical protein